MKLSNQDKCDIIEAVGIMTVIAIAVYLLS